MDILSAFSVLALLALFLMVSVFFISMYLDFQGLGISSYYGMSLAHWQSLPRKKAREMRKKYYEFIAKTRKGK